MTQTRKTYDTRVKYLVRQGLLPENYAKTISRSLISKWKREAPEKYTGYELNTDIEELYDLMKKISEDDRMVKVLRSFYRINKVLKDIIAEPGRKYAQKLAEHKYRIVDAIQRCKSTISVKRAVKMFGISSTTYRMWAMEHFHQCGHSVMKICNSVYPHQLTVKEVQKIHKYLTSEKFMHWPIISIAHYCAKKNILLAHPTTWYTYARKMRIARRRYRKKRKTYSEGIRAEAPNQKWHADISQYVTADGKTSYIYFVIDNFSRYILSWRIASKISAKIRLETFVEAIKRAGLQRDDERNIELIVDGGSENNNHKVETFMEKYPVEKIVALKDILFSNSMVEYSFRTVKYDYLFVHRIGSQTALKSHFRSFVIPDYNEKRPQARLDGLSPLEAYNGKTVNLKKRREKMNRAYKERVCYNRNNECLGCPFGCKRKNAA